MLTVTARNTLSTLSLAISLALGALTAEARVIQPMAGDDDLDSSTSQKVAQSAVDGWRYSPVTGRFVKLVRHSEEQKDDEEKDDQDHEDREDCDHNCDEEEGDPSNYTTSSGSPTDGKPDSEGAQSVPEPATLGLLGLGLAGIGFGARRRKA